MTLEFGKTGAETQVEDIVPISHVSLSNTAHATLADLETPCEELSLNAAREFDVQVGSAPFYSRFNSLSHQLSIDCITKSGWNKLAEWLSAPTKDIRTLDRRCDMILDFLKNPELREEAGRALAAFKNLEALEAFCLVEKTKKLFQEAKAIHVRTRIFPTFKEEDIPRERLSASSRARLASIENELAISIKEIIVRASPYDQTVDIDDLNVILDQYGHFLPAKRQEFEQTLFKVVFNSESIDWASIHLKNVIVDLHNAAMNISNILDSDSALSSATKRNLTELVNSSGMLGIVKGDPLVAQVQPDGSTLTVRLSQSKINPIDTGSHITKSAKEYADRIALAKRAAEERKHAKRKNICSVIGTTLVGSLGAVFLALGERGGLVFFGMALLAGWLVRSMTFKPELPKGPKGRFFTDVKPELVKGYEPKRTEDELVELSKQLIAASNLDAIRAAAKFYEEASKKCIANLSGKNRSIEAKGIQNLDVYGSDVTQVPNDIEIPCEEGTLVNGSNSGGKTELLKLTVLNQLLSQTFKLALADKYSAPLFDQIVSFAPGMSIKVEGGGRFKSEVSEVDEVFENLLRTGGSALITLDEWGQSTDPQTSRQTFEDGCTALVGAGGTLIAATQDLESVGHLVHNGVKLEDGTKLVFHGLKTVEEHGVPTYKFEPGVATSTNPEPILREKRFTRPEINLRILTAKRNRSQKSH